MNHARLLLASFVLVFTLASCDKPRSASDAAAERRVDDELAAERAVIEDERTALERQRLEEARAALAEEKAALDAEREARLAAREDAAGALDDSLEDRQRELEDREADLIGWENDLAERTGDLSEQELAQAGLGELEGWEPEPLQEFREPVADYETFYEDLEPYGSWFETPDYGYVYQPTVVIQDNSWRPYTRGRWACSNLGWAWVSDEPFGWACFHYGRWALIGGRGWVWVPGDEWAPSWVCWRESADHIGWAPLPPETLCVRGKGWGSSVDTEFGIGPAWFSFVHRRHMAEPLSRHCLPVDRNRNIIRESRNITRIQFLAERVIAGGPRYEALRRAVGKPWPVYQIQKDRLHALRHPGHRGATIHGNQLEVFAPNLRNRWNAALKPSKVAGQWRQLEVVRAEIGIKPVWVDRFRESRRELGQQSGEWTGAAGDMRDARGRLEANRVKVADAQRKSQAAQQAMAERRREKLASQRRPLVGSRPVKGGSRPAPVASREPAEGSPSAYQARAGKEDRDSAVAVPRSGRGVSPVMRDRPAAAEGRSGRGRESRERIPGPQADDPSSLAGNHRGQRVEEEPRQVRQATGRQDDARNFPRRDQGESIRPQQQVTGRETVEAVRRQRQEAEAVRQRQMAEVNARQEQARQAREESSRRQQLEEERRVAAERVRHQRALEQAEAARRQQEQLQQMREQQEQRARQQQEERAREQTERARQVEESRRQREERSRQQDQERAREQAERARQLDETRRQLEEARQRQREENAREDPGGGNGRRRTR